MTPPPIDGLSSDRPTESFKVFDLDGDPVRIGDKVGSAYSPSANLSRWNGEAWLKLDYPLFPDFAYIEDNKAIFETDKVSILYYLLDETTFEFEIILKETPPSDVLTIPFSSHNLKAYYQPPLSEDEYPKGYVVNATHVLNEKGELVDYRPLHIVSSFAFYHKSKSNNEYTTGKAFHLYRPLCIDGTGQEWLAEYDPDISEQTLTIILPAPFLASPFFPKTIDPTFGKTDVGGSTSDWITGYIRGSRDTLSEAGTVTQIECYVTQLNAGDLKLGIYDDDSPHDKHYGDETGVTIPAGSNWVAKSGLSESLSSDTYFLYFRSNATQRYYWDTGSSGDFDYYGWIGYGTAWPSTITPTGTVNNVISIFATYTPAGDTESPQWRSPIGTNTTLAGNSSTFYSNWTDNVELDGHIFSTNNTGAWANDTWSAWGGSPTEAWGNATKTLNSTVGARVEWRFYANDTSDNWNSTAVQYLITTMTYTPAPPISPDAMNVWFISSFGVSPSMLGIIVLWGIVFVASLFFAKTDNRRILFGLNAFFSLVMGLLFLADPTTLYKLIGAGVFVFGLYMIIKSSID